MTATAAPTTVSAKPAETYLTTLQLICNYGIHIQACLQMDAIRIYSSKVLDTEAIKRVATIAVEATAHYRGMLRADKKSGLFDRFEKLIQEKIVFDVLVRSGEKKLVFSEPVSEPKATVIPS